MKKTVHTIVSPLVATVLGSTTLVSAATSGIEADLTVSSFACLVVYALVELVILSYSELPLHRSPSTVRSARPAASRLVSLPDAARVRCEAGCDRLAA